MVMLQGMTLAETNAFIHKPTTIPSALIEAMAVFLVVLAR
jgi:hypothetical protein